MTQGLLFAGLAFFIFLRFFEGFYSFASLFIPAPLCTDSVRCFFCAICAKIRVTRQVTFGTGLYLQNVFSLLYCLWRERGETSISLTEGLPPGGFGKSLPLDLLFGEEEKREEKKEDGEV